MLKCGFSLELECHHFSPHSRLLTQGFSNGNVFTSGTAMIKCINSENINLFTFFYLNARSAQSLKTCTNNNNNNCPTGVPFIA